MSLSEFNVGEHEYEAGKYTVKKSKCCGAPKWSHSYFEVCPKLNAVRTYSGGIGGSHDLLRLTDQWYSQSEEGVYFGGFW